MGQTSAQTASPQPPVLQPRRFEGPLEALGALAHVVRGVPALVRAYRGGVPPARREAVMVAVSRANACSGCTTVHQRWALRAGVTPDELYSIGLGDLAALDHATQSAVVYATERAAQQFRSEPQPDVTTTAQLRLGEKQLEQVDAVARLMSFANLTLNTMTRAVTGRRQGGGPTSAHPVFARVWPVLSSRAMSDDARHDLLANLTGTVVEPGAGDGSNFAHNPATVPSVLAIEPEPQLRGLARRAAQRAAVPATVVDGTAESMPAADNSYDAAVSCLVLCTVPDQARALAELKRVLRPGGELRFYEHVTATDRRRSVQRWLDRTGIRPRLGAGCHLSRDTLSAVRDAGFIIEDYRELDTGVGRLSLPHIAGVARVPLTAQ